MPLGTEIYNTKRETEKKTIYHIQSNLASLSSQISSSLHVFRAFPLHSLTSQLPW